MNAKSLGEADPAPGTLHSGRVTSYDVARLAGVSQSAVSRALRENAPVSEETRAKVRDAARRLGYAPSNVARSLITRRSRTAGVVVTELTVRNYPDVLFHLGHEIQAAGSRMLVFTLPRDESVGALLDDLVSYHVDGVISAASMPAEMLEVFARRRLPVVLYNRVASGNLASAVACDHAAGMAELVDHLLAGGLGEVAFLAGPEGAPVSEDRLLGAREALAARGRALARVAHADYSYDGGRRAAPALLAGPTPPDTLICGNDAMALGALDACRHDLGLRVPGDVAVTGFDDIPQAAWPSYELTTLHQPVAAMTRSAVGMLMEAVEGGLSRPERRVMRPEFRPRGSTRAVSARPTSSLPKPEMSR